MHRVSLGFVFTILWVGVGAASADRPNVLFIAIDDLRPALGCYGDPIAVTPNFDRVARRGIVFRRAYCQQAVCSPSRLSLLTGRRPDTIRVWDLATHFRQAAPNVVTMPQHFKNNGYHTQSFGKIFHGNGQPAKDPPSWSVEPRFDVVRDAKVRYALPKNLEGSGLKRSAAELAEVPDDYYIDGIVCNAATKTLANLKQRPFFLAVGFRKPHLPFCAPKKYWDLYARDKIPLPESGEYPRNAPELATRNWRELEGYADIADETKLKTAKTRELRHGYYACVSYVDALLGRLLDELTRLKLAENTVVVLWGDHGFHLGEQGLWTKSNNYELATRVPLIVAVPEQMEGTAGRATDALVELIDLYPTLVEICGLESPAGIEGVSFKPLLKEPNQAWKTAAFSQYPRARQGRRHQGRGDIMGYAVRTDRYRYVEWREWTSEKVVARELYDHESDPQEARNVVAEAKYGKTAAELAGILRRGWRFAVPRRSELP